MNINNLTKTGDELIAAYREQMVLGTEGQNIFSDALKYRNGELVQLAHALICNNLNLAPTVFFPREILHLFALPDIERLIVAGAYIAAQVDVYNLMAHLDNHMKDVQKMQNKILP